MFLPALITDRNILNPKNPGTAPITTSLSATIFLIASESDKSAFIPCMPASLANFSNFFSSISATVT